MMTPTVNRGRAMGRGDNSGGGDGGVRCGVD